MSKKLLCVAALAAFVCAAGSASAATITLKNGDFEANGTLKNATAFGDDSVTGWTALPGGGGYDDSGIEEATGNAGFGMSAFLKVTDVNTGAYQVVGKLSDKDSGDLLSKYTDLGVGSVLTLTFDAAATSNTAKGHEMDVRIFSTTNGGATQETLASYTGAMGDGNAWLRNLVLEYTLTAGDIGKEIGISFRMKDTGGYVGFDSFKLEYTAAVPEPSTYALLGGLAAAGVALAARRRRKN